MKEYERRKVGEIVADKYSIIMKGIKTQNQEAQRNPSKINKKIHIYIIFTFNIHIFKLFKKDKRNIFQAVGK